MAHELEMTVVAEGVETRFQYDFLIAAGCDELQGYYLSKPLNVEAIKEFIRPNNLPSEPTNL